MKTALTYSLIISSKHSQLEIINNKNINDYSPLHSAQDQECLEHGYSKLDDK